MTNENGVILHWVIAKAVCSPKWKAPVRWVKR